MIPLSNPLCSRLEATVKAARDSRAPVLLHLLILKTVNNTKVRRLLVVSGVLSDAHY